ncbi:HNH endonuclease signature motif containing protein [uncultured Clostridium sp.]|uniref:HNH endonuclease n=1 Tax=uncultured Clostridium sp. TaxID=59620 RepID=UPI002608DF65|nr:HNH endonuclease signature motif containing protein [uncultured Clostridium sp.]
MHSQLQNIQINNKLYNLTDQLNVSLPDSFVSPNNKIGSGSGEARLYISSQNSKPIFTFSPNEFITKKGNSYPACTSSCFLLKENLLEYLDDTHNYYLNPTQKHNRDISRFYNHRAYVVNHLNDLLEFKIYMQNGNLDSARFYIGCADSAWDIIRELAIPKFSHLTISQYTSSASSIDIIYIFTLSFSAPNTPMYTLEDENFITNTITNDTTISSTVRLSLIKARNGQGKFRSNVFNIMPACPFTGISDSFLLRASHIMPWSQCINNYQRLDGYNGLTLTPTYDVLFDKGLISFNNDGSLIVSSKLNSEITSTLNLVPGSIYNIGNLDGCKNPYLDFHRSKIFKY